MPSLLPRGQFGIEFFLIVGFVLLIASALLSNAATHLEQNDRLRDAVFARAAVDGVADGITFVSWQGDGSKIVNEYYLPSSGCIIVNRTDNTVECDVGLTQRVKSHAFTASSTATISPFGCTSGWKKITVSNTNGAPAITCAPLP